jgi:hypothetical protein
MSAIAEAFRAGGVWMYLILLLVMAEIPLAIGGVVFLGMGFFRKIARGWHAGVAVFFTLFTLVILAVGLVGQWEGIANMEAALEFAAPEVRDTLREAGEAVARYPWRFSQFAAVVPGLLTIVIFVRAALIQPDWQGAQQDKPRDSSPSA